MGRLAQTLGLANRHIRCVKYSHTQCAALATRTFTRGPTGLTKAHALTTMRHMIQGTQLRTHRQELGLSQAKLSEISGIPQHVLSSVELGKSSLDTLQYEAVRRALADGDQVASISKREKRYRQHSYAPRPVLSERQARASRSDGNAEYCTVLSELLLAHLHSKSEKLTALSLFSGCGGFSLGFSSAGFDIKGFVELEQPLRAIYKENFPNSAEIGSDITLITDEALAAHRHAIGEVDAIVGGPPCQGFSLSGKRDVDDPRNQLFRHYLRFVDIFRPKIAILENVRLLTSMRNPEGTLVSDDICREFRLHGYNIEFFETNAKNFGVPQHRERVIFFAVRDDLKIRPCLPPSMYGVTSDLFSSSEPCRSFADACSDLSYIESGGKSNDSLHEAVAHPEHVIDWLWNVPEGVSAHDNADPQMRPPSGYNTTYKRQIWNEPGATVQTTFGMISGCRNVHPIATRSLTVREAARLQSFPDGYKFFGTLGAIRTGIGNAVPPLLARELALHTKRLLQIL